MASNEKAGRVNLKSLNGLGWKIHDHLKEHRPKMYRDLKQQNQLNQYLIDQQTHANDRMAFLESQGMQPHEAMDMLKDQIFLPTEEDLPNLGESLKPYTD